MNVVFIYDVGYVPLQSKHERRNVSSDLTFHVEKKKVVYRRFTICRQLSVCGIENAHIQPVHDQVRMRVSALWACASVCVCLRTTTTSAPRLPEKEEKDSKSNGRSLEYRRC